MFTESVIDSHFFSVLIFQKIFSSSIYGSCFKIYIFFIKEVIVLSYIFAPLQENKHEILKFSVIFNLIVLTTLTLTQRILVDSVTPTHSISKPTRVTQKTPKKQTNKSLFTDERNFKVKSLVKSIPIRFLKFVSRCYKEDLHTALNVFRRFSVCYKVSPCTKVGHIYRRSILGTYLIFPSVFIKAWLMLI